MVVASFVLHASHWQSINAKVASSVFCLLALVEGTHGGATTTALDATPPPPPAICQNLAMGRPEGLGGGSAVRGGGVPKVGGPTRDPLLPHAYIQGGCVSGAGLGKLLVAVVKQRLQMGRCVHNGGGDPSLCNKRHLLSASSC